MEEILNYTFNLLEYNFNDVEKNKYIHFLNNANDSSLITEKNIVKNSQEDNYTFGNYYNLKEKDANVINIFFNNNFLKKYTSEDEKNYLEYLKSKNIDLEHINKFLTIYNNIKLSKIKKIQTNYNNDFENYII